MTIAYVQVCVGANQKVHINPRTTVTPWPQLSLFSLLFWLGQGVTWGMYVFSGLGVLYVYKCFLSRCLCKSMVAQIGSQLEAGAYRCL